MPIKTQLLELQLKIKTNFNRIFFCSFSKLLSKVKKVSKIILQKEPSKHKTLSKTTFDGGDQS